MATPTWYGDGTASVVVGSRTVTGTGTGWLTAVAGLTPIKSGDKFGIHVGRPIVIEQIISDTELRLADDWPGPAQTDAPYKVELTSPTIAAVEAMRRLLASLSNGNLEGLSKIEVGVDDIPIGIGPGVFGTVNKAQLVNGVEFDVQVNTLADRAAYNAAATGFKVLVSNVGDGRSALYSKKSATSGDWSNPSYITGPTGIAGPYTEITVGPTTTLPAGSSATVTPVVVDADTVRLDFGLPKGLDGSGTGDVTGAASSVDGQFAAANGATGKSLKFLTAAQARQTLGGWEFIGSYNIAGLSVLDVTNLGAYRTLRINGAGVFNANNDMNIRFSENNGSTFGADSDEFLYTLIGTRAPNSGSGAVGETTDGLSSGNFFLYHGGNTGYPTLAECVIYEFNQTRNAGTFVSSRLSTSTDRYVRMIGAAHKRATVQNALRFYLNGTTVQSGMIYLEGIRG